MLTNANPSIVRSSSLENQNESFIPRYIEAGEIIIEYIEEDEATIYITIHILTAREISLIQISIWLRAYSLLV